jgi:hypothetical protein
LEVLTGVADLLPAPHKFLVTIFQQGNEIKKIALNLSMNLKNDKIAIAVL